jgi:hypothetical protein
MHGCRAIPGPGSLDPGVGEAEVRLAGFGRRRGGPASGSRNRVSDAEKSYG